MQKHRNNRGNDHYASPPSPREEVTTKPFRVVIEANIVLEENLPYHDKNTNRINYLPVEG